MNQKDLRTEARKKKDSQPLATGLKSGTAIQNRGKAQARKILAEARRLLINAGFAGLSLRKIAKNLNISLGNLTYYFPSKDALMRALISDLLDAYHQAMVSEQSRFPGNPHARFRAYIDYLISDCQNSDTRALFFQIWGLARNTKIVRDLRNEMYARFRADVRPLIEPLLPGASRSGIDYRVGVLAAMIEGLHVIYDLDENVLQLPADFAKRFRDAACQLIAPNDNPGTT
ncbi:MAG: TetR/AcrR family transcriptional regulator [Steroidobacteraceae bacterium]